MFRRILLIILFLGLLYHKSKSQTTAKLNEPVIGEICPDFTIRKIDFYKKNEVSLKDFRGKWLILDFWAKDCSGCITSFPRVSKEQSLFKDSIQFLMIAKDEVVEENRSIYRNFHDRFHLQMPGAYDSLIFDRFNVGSLPHLIIIDPNGIVRAITIRTDSAQLSGLLRGGHPDFMQASYADQKEKKDDYKYDQTLPFMIYGNGGLDSAFLFRSLLTKWKPGISARSNDAMIHDDLENENYHDRGRFEQIGSSIADLYFVSYTGRTRWVFDKDSNLYGKFWPFPVLEVRDPASIVSNINTGENSYCYSLVVPPARATKEYMMQVMQTDLKNYFGYDVFIEERKMSCWFLRATKEAGQKLRSTGRKTNAPVPKKWQGVSLTDYPMSDFVKAVSFYAGLNSSSIPVIDETGITGNIDISVNWFKGDLNSVKAALQGKGLDLVKGEKLMKVLVIKDPVRQETVRKN